MSLVGPLRTTSFKFVRRLVPGSVPLVERSPLHLSLTSTSLLGGLPIQVVDVEALLGEGEDST